MLAETSQYNPYDTSLSWLSVLGYNTNLIHAVSDGNFQGIFGSATSGSAALTNYTSGSIDEYDFNISGNVLDAFYWGVTVNVNSITSRVTMPRICSMPMFRTTVSIIVKPIEQMVALNCKISCTRAVMVPV